MLAKRLVDASSDYHDEEFLVSKLTVIHLSINIDFQSLISSDRKYMVLNIHRY
jgi:hypothetical protein